MNDSDDVDGDEMEKSADDGGGGGGDDWCRSFICHILSRFLSRIRGNIFYLFVHFWSCELNYLVIGVFIFSISASSSDLYSCASLQGDGQ